MLIQNLIQSSNRNILIKSVQINCSETTEMQGRNLKVWATGKHYNHKRKCYQKKCFVSMLFIFFPHDAAVVFVLFQRWLEISLTACSWLKNHSHLATARRQWKWRQDILLNTWSWGKIYFVSTCNTGMVKEI